ncbi:hypothetical protein AY600_02260 [Phormidium willei BDU 130791]|nr:hypothetical protein AY600_02260 [Phormidium willei BDU 130791]
MCAEGPAALHPPGAVRRHRWVRVGAARRDAPSKAARRCAGRAAAGVTETDSFRHQILSFSGKSAAAVTGCPAWPCDRLDGAPRRAGAWLGGTPGWGRARTAEGRHGR